MTPQDEGLREDARRSALSVIHLWAAPSIVREYLTSGDEKKRAAAKAAAWARADGDWTIAWGAAEVAAVWAARSAAWACSGDATEPREVALYAASNAARALQTSLNGF